MSPAAPEAPDGSASFVAYAVATGAILWTGHCPTADLPLQASDPSVGVLEIEPALAAAVRLGLHYVRDGAIADRPVMAVEQDGLTFTGLPAGTMVQIEGRTYTVDDGELELSFDLPGTYTVRFECWPYQPVELEVTG